LPSAVAGRADDVWVNFGTQVPEFGGGGCGLPKLMPFISVPIPATCRHIATVVLVQLMAGPETGGHSEGPGVSDMPG